MSAASRLIVAFWLALTLAGAANFDALQPQGYVSDYANILDPAHRQELERYCKRVEELTKAEMSLVTLPTLEGEPIEDVANNLYRRWGVGKKGTNEGIMLLLVTNDRRMRLEVGYGLEPILPDGFAGRILRQMRPLLRDRQYGPALLEAAHQIGGTVARAKNINLDVSIPSRREVQHRPEFRSWLPFLFPIGMLLLLFFLSNRSRRGHGYHDGGGFFPFIIPGGGGGGWGSGRSSGGGFGGYDSSDSFGGFGGGDSGGGGASSDW